MSAFVIDASVTMAWCIRDESTDRTDALYQRAYYDAAYLELAIRRALLLATLDDELGRACTAASIPLL